MANEENEDTATSDPSGERGLANDASSYASPDLGAKSRWFVLSFKPASLSSSRPPPGDLGLAGPFVGGPVGSEMLSPDGRALTPNVCSIHSFSCTAMSSPTPSTLSRDSASISFCSTCNLFFAHIVCRTPFFPLRVPKLPTLVETAQAADLYAIPLVSYQLPAAGV